MPRAAPTAPPRTLALRCAEILREYGPLGFIAFGGPGVHIGILRKRFVDELRWLDATTFADLFALGNALPGPGSTQLAFSIAILRNGLIAGFLAFLCWSLPSSIGMAVLATGVKRIPASLPPIVLDLLTGLTATAVGLIAMSAANLARSTAKRGITRFLLFVTAAVSTCYSAPWLYPVLTAGSGLVTLGWELLDIEHRARRAGATLRRKLGHKQQEQPPPPIDALEMAPLPSQPSPVLAKGPETPNISRLPTPPPEPERASLRLRRQATATSEASTVPPILPPQVSTRAMLIAGAVFVTTFAAVLIIVLTLQATTPQPPRALTLFANLFVAGTIIFGGGPVVIPLLQSYVVEPGWVSTQNFLLGFAILQAFPGPNFSFAVFLGFLSLPSNPVLGGFLAYLAIFSPGLLLKAALIPVYRKIRDKPVVRSVLLGLNAGATGLIFSAVYRLWIVGALLPDSRTASLDISGWWLVVATGGYLAADWCKLPPYAVILCGAIAGLLHHAVVMG